MLSLHIEIEAIELIMSCVYLSPESVQPPGSATTGLVRAVALLAEWDWKTEPLVIPLSAMTSSPNRVRVETEDRTIITGAFSELRNKDKGMTHSAWVIATEDDPGGLRWTSGITKVIANRVKRLANATVQALKEATEKASVDVQVSIHVILSIWPAV